MRKIELLKELVENNNNLDVTKTVLELFKDQIENNTAWTHLILTKEQFDSIDDNFDFSILGDILVSIELNNEINFVHYFDISNMNSIKEKGLLVSCSNKNSDYIPDMGYGVYVMQGDCAYDMSDELAEFMLERYDGEDIEIGFVEGLYKGKYLECIYGYQHEGYILLKEDVSLDMINNIESEYISGLAEDYCDYWRLDF